MSNELLSIHVADGMSISVGRHVGTSGQVVQNAHIIKLQGQWQLFVQESHNQPWRTYLNGHPLPDNSQHSISSGAFISFSHQDYGGGGFNVENGWIKVGDSALTVSMPQQQPHPNEHMVQSYAQQAVMNPVSALPPTDYAPVGAVQAASVAVTASPPKQPRPRANKAAASSAMSAAHSSDREERGGGGKGGKKQYRCTGEWVDEKTGLLVKCTKTFTTSGHLARHKRLHGGEKPYKCPLDICNSRFSRHDNMNQHYRAHARKLGIEIIPQTAPTKNSPGLSSDEDEDDDDDEDEDIEPATPPSRGTTSRRRGGAQQKDMKQEYEDYYGQHAGQTPQGGVDGQGYYDQGTPNWGQNNLG